MTPDPMDRSRLDAVRDYVAQARWFGGKGRDFTVSDVRRLGTVAESPELRSVVDLVTVAYADGGEELYQLPLGLYPAPEERLGHAYVGAWEEEGATVHAYDAVHDREAMAGWLAAFVEADVVSTSLDHRGELDHREGLAFHRLGDHELDVSTHSTLFSGEQSNSSLAFGDDALLKVFRKLTPGENPDITIHRVLTEAGSDNVAHLYGWVERGDLQLGMLQQFLRTASDGWDLALSSVRNLYAEADLYADEVGGDFAAEAGRLGEAVAAIHQVLAEHFPTAVRSAEEMRGLAEAMQRRLDEARAVVPELDTYSAPLSRVFAGVADLEGTPVQQVHGDLHLGQTLRTSKGWKIVDFEGEPAKPLAERVLPDSPWRDVAGMLRSFDYAPQVAARTATAVRDESGEEQRSYRAVEWSRRNGAAFLECYAGRDLTPEEHQLLTAYVADKAIYECVYEARNRPGWVGVPLGALARLLEEDHA